ncbi:MAG: alpha/beta hydrolase [bacterium]
MSTVFFCGCFTYNYAEKDLFEPQKETQLASVYRFERLFLNTSDSVEIEGWWLSREDAELTIFFLPGNSWNLRHRIPAFNAIASRIKANIFAVNYRGYGLSSGEPTVDGICRDGETAMAFLRDHIQPKRVLPLYILGYSLGSYVALSLATRHPCEGIILLAGFTCTKEVMEHARQKRIPVYARLFVRIKPDSCLYKLDNLTLCEAHFPTGLIRPRNQ